MELKYYRIINIQFIMKKITIILVLSILTSINVCAQTVVPYTSFHLTNPYTKKIVNFSVLLMESERGDFVFLETYGKAKESFLEIPVENLDSLQNSLKYYRSKYTEWKDIAKKNNVSELQKKMEYHFPKCGVYWKESGGNSWSSKGFDYNIEPTFMINHGQCIFRFWQTVKDSSNRYIKSEISLVLSSLYDFDTLINTLDPNKIKQKLTQIKSKKNLFK